MIQLNCGVIVALILVCVGMGCLTQEEADEVEIFVQEVKPDQTTSSVNISIAVFYRNYEIIEDARLVCYLKKYEHTQWYATGETTEITIGHIDRGFNQLYYPGFSNLTAGKYMVVLQIIDGANETRGETLSPSFEIL